MIICPKLYFYIYLILLAVRFKKDNRLLIKYTSQGGRIDYDSGGNRNTFVIAGTPEP